MKDKRRHGDPDRIMEHAEAGYCLSYSEELRLSVQVNRILGRIALYFFTLV